MKAFAFKLESILKLRERAEEEARQNHAAAGRRLDAAIAELDAAEQEHKRVAGQIGEVQRTSFRPAERDILWNALQFQQDLCQRLALKAGQARKDAEDMRELLLAARTKHEAMIKMREKERLLHAEMTQREEKIHDR